MRVGFIGLGNVGSKLAGSLLRNGIELTVRDLDATAAQPLLDAGAQWGDSPAAMTSAVDMMITCLPSPAISAAVLEADNGILAALRPGQIWAEMSTTDEAEVRRLGALVTAAGAEPIDCPVSGGCHRAATGNIAIFAGCERATFERALPVLSIMGRQILHTGELGSASILKVMTNYLATANLVTLSEALVTSKMAGLDLATTYEAIRISSGNSFVHETESQVILNGSRDISFTMDLVSKDIGIFQAIAERHDVPLEVSPVLVQIFKDGEARYGSRELSPNIIRRLEDALGIEVLAPGFPAEMTDYEPEQPGYEVRPRRSPLPGSRGELSSSADHSSPPDGRGEPGDAVGAKDERAEPRDEATGRA
jgi:3-hydroxyisobutyrate dehydrogenase